MSLQVILGGILLYANAAKGVSALQMSRDLDVQYKTAYVLLHKLRETVWKMQDTDLMTGDVEVDGGYMHTYVRPKNKRVDRPDRRLLENQNPQKCVMLVLRERHKPQQGKGAKRTRVFVLRSENEKDIRAVLERNVSPTARIYTDEAQGYTTLSATWPHFVVSHANEYQTDDGVNENQAESYISRFRRMMMGQIHRLNRKYLDVYAAEVAFREDNRRESNGSFVKDVVQKCLLTGPSRDWKGYWQGNKREGDCVLSF